MALSTVHFSPTKMPQKSCHDFWRNMYLSDDASSCGGTASVTETSWSSDDSSTHSWLFQATPPRKLQEENRSRSRRSLIIPMTLSFEEQENWKRRSCEQALVKYDATSKKPKKKAFKLTLQSMIFMAIFAVVFLVLSVGMQCKNSMDKKEQLAATPRSRRTKQTRATQAPRGSGRKRRGSIPPRSPLDLHTCRKSFCSIGV